MIPNFFEQMSKTYLVKGMLGIGCLLEEVNEELENVSRAFSILIRPPSPDTLS